MGDDDDRTCYVGNFTSAMTTDLLEELFTQVGPVEKVTLADKNSYRFAMVVFEDEESVPFATKTLDGISLFNTPLKVKPRNGSKHETAYKSAMNLKRQESSDDYHSNSSRRDSSRRSYDERLYCHSTPRPSLAVLGTVTPPPRPPPNSSLKIEARSLSTPHCGSSSSTSSRFSGRPGDDERRTFPVKPSDTRVFENELRGVERWYGSGRRRPYSYRDSRYLNSSGYRSNYEYRRY
ncbi:hypothetical protein KIN20_006933 [Parelaphostrongylus tenuis]|uniref:RRM domain-containing protein n=1 Tax=Parelaphostrongylus tenuis TaxID=148309 RepID=A0AAD5MNB9_PARTN|nr:hypothetical protein KIN20_006933 [Parelaphostrongylus tenuis]